MRRKRFAHAAQTLRKRFAITSRIVMLYDRSAIAAQTLRNHFAIAARMI
jgi:hypothetical protein